MWNHFQSIKSFTRNEAGPIYKIKRKQKLSGTYNDTDILWDILRTVHCKQIEENERKFVNRQVQNFVKQLADANPPVTADLSQLEAKRLEIKAAKANEYKDKKEKCMERDCCPLYFVFVLLGLPGANLSYLAAQDLSKSSESPFELSKKGSRIDLAFRRLHFLFPS